MTQARIPLDEVALELIVERPFHTLPTQVYLHVDTTGHWQCYYGELPQGLAGQISTGTLTERTNCHVLALHLVDALELADD